VGKANCGNEELPFLASAIKEGRTSRRRRLKMQLALNNRRRFLNLVCLLLLFYYLIPKGTSQLLVQFVPVVGFFKIHLFCYFLSKPLPAFKIRNIAYRSGLFTSSKYISCSRSQTNTNLPALPAFCSKRSKQTVCA